MSPDDIFVVDSHEKAQELLAVLSASGSSLYGVDCETVDCNPKKQSPVLTARIVCWSVAWKEGALTRSAFIWADYLEDFRAWLEDPTVLKAGASFTSYDMHCFENHGILVRGFVHCNKHTSRLWYSSKEVAHDLKSQAVAGLGAVSISYASLFSRPARTKSKTYKATRHSKPRKGPLAGVPTLTCEGTVSTFSSKKRVLIPLDEVRSGGLYESRLEALYVYAAADAQYSLELAPYREKQLASRPAKYGSTLKLYNDVWNPMLLQLNRMERAGITVDPDVCEPIRTQAQADMDALLPGIRKFADDDAFNPGSSDSLRKLLFEWLGLRQPPIKGTMWAISRADKEEWSTSEASLHWLQIKHPEYNAQLDLIRRWKKTRRQMQTARDLPSFIGADGRVHCVLGPDTDTGRLSCKLPALQQVSSKNDIYGIRGAFVAAPGKRLIVADYSQLEVYVLAHMLIRLFGDYSLRDALASGDVYTWIARQCWPDQTAEFTNGDFKTKKTAAAKLRDLAKILVLATNYGKTPLGLGLSLLDELGEPKDEQFCADLLSTYMGALPGIPRWQTWIADYAKKHRGVPTLLGRWRPLPFAGTRRGDRQALNSPIQGGACDVVVLGMLALNTSDLVPGWFHPELAATGARCLLQIHDELVYEVPEENADVALKLIVQGMENPPLLELAVKLRVEAKIGRTWQEGK